MKIFGWMQSKFNGKQGTKKSNSTSAYNHHMPQEPRKEEFSDWPHALLAIGTFGNNNLKKEPESCNLQGSQSSCQDHLQDITPEDIGELQKELGLLMHKQVYVESSSAEESEIHNFPLEKFFNCPPSLEVIDRDTSETVCDESANKENPLQDSNNVVISSGKGIRLDNTNNTIGKKSVSFLLKKMFLCRSGFTPTPSVRDSLPEPKMEKILRAILHKKIYPQSSSPKGTAKRYLENKYMTNTDSEDEMLEKENDGSKWVKTDSEFIVLEI